MPDPIREAVERLPIFGQGGLLEYKCDRCGGLDRSTHAPDIFVCVMNLSQGWALPKEWIGAPAGMVSMHRCPDGCHGITRLVGGVPDSLEKQTTTPPPTPHHASADVPAGSVVVERAFLRGIIPDLIMSADAYGAALLGVLRLEAQNKIIQIEQLLQESGDG